MILLKKNYLNNKEVIMIKILKDNNMNRFLERFKRDRSILRTILGKTGKKSFILIIILSFILTSFVRPQNLVEKELGFKFYKNFTYVDYNNHPQNWGISQDNDGIIYVANQGGVLIYDGDSWQVQGIPDYEPVRSLAVDKFGIKKRSQKVFIGGEGKIGYLIYDEKGKLHYISLLKHLTKVQRNFSRIWRTHSTKEGVYFNSYEYIFRWDSKNKKMKVWNASAPSKRFFYSFYINGRYFVQQENVGLMEMINDSLQLVQDGGIFADEKERIFMIVPYNIGMNSQTLLIGAQLQGFFLYEGKRMKPFHAEVDEFLKGKTSNHGIRLSSGDFALATNYGGVVIIDSMGNIKMIYAKPSGIQDDSVKYLYEDNQGNLWMCLEKGITRIEYLSPFSIHDERSGLPGMVLSISRYNNNIFVGTTRGLFTLKTSLNFNLVSGLSIGCWSLFSDGNSLLAATESGVFQLDKHSNNRRINADKSFVLLNSTHYPGHIWCGTNDRLLVLSQQKGLWYEKSRYTPIYQEIRSIAEDNTGNLWLSTVNNVIFKVDNPLGTNTAIVNIRAKDKGLPEGEINIIQARGHVVFATAKGIYRFDEGKGRFIPDLIIGVQFAGAKSGKPVFRLIEDHDKHIWVHSESRNYQIIPGPLNTNISYDKPFLRLPNIQVNVIYPDTDGDVVWFGSIEGLMRYDKASKKKYDQVYPALINKIMSNRITSIYERYNNRITSQIKMPILAYEERNLLFACSTTFFEDEVSTRFRFFLEGNDEHWSDWVSESQKEYTNLGTGNYSFQVQAKNVYGTLSRPAAFQFKILPPWYRTWWSISLYIIGSIVMVFLIVKWRSSRLEQEKLKLEQIVTERTKEIKNKNQQLEEQTVQLKEQSKKLREMDQIKSSFFANISHEFRTPLTLIMSPVEEMIPQIKNKTHIDKLNLIQKSSQRLLWLINQLLDLSRIDSGKMKLETRYQDIIPFLKGLYASFLLQAQHKKIEMHFKSGEKCIFLYFDSQKMEDIMNNLLMNALKFTPSGGRITISVVKNITDSFEYEKNSGFIEISVTDTGVGIPKEQLPYIFDRFFQVQGTFSNEQQYKGTGIGLALIKELVILHKGKINVHSSEGKGSTFVVRLPLGKEHLKPEEIIDSSMSLTCKNNEKMVECNEKVFVPSEIHGDSSAEIDVIEGEANNEDNIQIQQKNVILVVEDHDDVRKYIRAPLEQFYTVVEAKNGKEGIEIAKEIIPDLIVSDIMMPIKDGCELCRDLKTDIKTSHIPIILLTAKASEESVIQGLETGADDYLTKPFNTKILLTRIKNLIDLRRQMQLKIQRQKMLLPAEIHVSSQDEKFLKEFQQVIEKNLMDPDFNVDELCKKLYMGRSTLFRKIQALTGETPNQFILSYRLERGAQLLKDNYGNVTEVAMAVGFSSSPYFAKCFKEKFNQSPSSFQASMSKN